MNVSTRNDAGEKDRNDTGEGERNDAGVLMGMARIDARQEKKIASY